MSEPRLIFYHKQSTSARTRFLRLDHGGVCGCDALPAGATLLGEETENPESACPPAALIAAAESRLALPGGSLEAERGYCCRVATPDGTIQVYLARFTAIDPPFDEVAVRGAAFIDLTQARGLPAVELALLRRAYEWIMG